MGCHTLFQVPLVTGKKEIIELAKLILKRADSVSTHFDSNGFREMHELAIQHELIGPVKNLASEMMALILNGNEFHWFVHTHFDNKWVLYQEAEAWELCRINRKFGTHYRYVDDIQLQNHKNEVEIFPDDPRITGYPDKIIYSYEEMVDFINTGFEDIDRDEHVFTFHGEKRSVMRKIKKFFTKYPEGIIVFG